MNDPNITMEEYIGLEEEKAQKHGKVFKWETAKYGKIWYDEDIHDLRSFETEFLAIAFNDEVSSEKTLSCKPTVSSLNDEINFRVSFDDSNDEDYMFDPKRYYKDGDCVIMLWRPRIEGLNFYNFVLSLLILQLWLFQFVTRGISTLGRARRRMSWRQFILALGLYTDEEMQTVGFGPYWAENARQIPDKGDLRDYWIEISSAGDFLGTAMSYTMIQEPIIRLCHRLIACSIARRSQAPKKVSVTDLFYLRGMDVGSVNVPYLLARYLRLFGDGRKIGAHMSGGQLQICEQLDDMWAWVALGPERQLDAMVGAPETAEDAPAMDEGGQANPAPVQAPPPLPPPTSARTMP
nr:hypothetical protein [Tanacetum cinerariifolium]